jgi:hypothetical protein
MLFKEFVEFWVAAEDITAGTVIFGLGGLITYFIKDIIYVVIYSVNEQFRHSDRYPIHLFSTVHIGRL